MATTVGELLQWRAGQLPGRTSDGKRDLIDPDIRFNGGPGNCPAELGAFTRARGTPLALQWRAGQLPGRTGRIHSSTGNAASASMEGRAIARPNHEDPVRGRHRGSGFNGGPGNCPAERAGFGPCDPSLRNASMEGRAIARPNVDDQTTGVTEDPVASMEGRAIARPN